MNPYDDMNLPQLLSLMHPPVLPPPVSWVPQTPGWWVLAAWFSGLVILLGVRIYRKHRRNRYRREALAELEQIAVRCETEPERCAREIAELLKCTALSAFPRAQVASLFGHDWVVFLEQTSARAFSSDNTRNPLAESESALQLFAKAAYVKEIDVARLIAAARRWIECHHA